MTSGSLPTVRVGRSGLAVSRVGVGCNAFGSRIDSAQTARVVHAAVDRGITFFDTAEGYGSRPGESEEFLGAALAGGRRDSVVVASKFGYPGGRALSPDWEPRGSRNAVRRAVEGSLRRLRTDRIDLYQMHRPDPTTPIDETLRALDDLVREGKVRYVGSSNFAAWQVVDADRAAAALGVERFVSAQNHYNLLHRDPERELIPACRHVGVGLLPYYPLASGLLTGKYRRGQEPPDGSRLSQPRARARYDTADWDRLEALEEFAAEREVSLLHVAVGGLAAQPAVASVIAGARSPEQVHANADAALWQPTAEDLAEIDTITAPSRDA
ncbi:MAG: aldo/keto reductase [Kineosporiaceae bacterium]